MNTLQINPYVLPGIPPGLKLVTGNAVNNPSYIIRTVCNYLKINIEKVKSKRRKREIVNCRQICMYFLKKNTELTLKQIGALFSKDHSNVLYAIDTVNDLVFTAKNYRVVVMQLEEMLK